MVFRGHFLVAISVHASGYLHPEAIFFHNGRKDYTSSSNSNNNNGSVAISSQPSPSHHRCHLQRHCHPSASSVVCFDIGLARVSSGSARCSRVGRSSQARPGRVRSKGSSLLSEEEWLMMACFRQKYYVPLLFEYRTKRRHKFLGKIIIRNSSPVYNELLLTM